MNVIVVKRYGHFGIDKVYLYQRMNCSFTYDNWKRINDREKDKQMCKLTFDSN